MLTWSKIAPARRELLEALVAEFAHNYGKGRTTLAVAFRRAGFEVFRASVDDFHRPRELRYLHGRFSAEGYYRDAFDYSLLRRVLLEPFRMGGSTGFQVRGFDLARDIPMESDWTTGPADAILIVDGVFLQRAELHGIWNYSIWLDAPLDVRLARMAERDGADLDPEVESNQRYIGAQRLYVRDIHPNTAANAIVDNTEPEVPVRSFADFCSIEPAPL